MTGLGGGLWASYLSRMHVGARLDVDGTDANVRLALGPVDARMGSIGAFALAGGSWRLFAFDAGGEVFAAVSRLCRGTRASGR